MVHLKRSYLWLVLTLQVSAQAFAAEPSVSSVSANGAAVALLGRASPQVFLRQLDAVDIAGRAQLTSAEIVRYDHISQRLYVVNSEQARVEVFALSLDPAKQLRLAHLATYDVGLKLAGWLEDLGQQPKLASTTSLDVLPSQDLLAVAVTAVKPGNGYVAFLRASDGELINAVQVGALPDMLAFTPDGTRLVVANEGEPTKKYTIDPPGSVSIITLPKQSDAKDLAGLSASTIELADQGAELAVGVRLSGPGANPATDLEPEYIAISKDSQFAYVGLQENNAIAIIDLADSSVSRIWSLGAKNLRESTAGIDASDKDGIVNIQPWPVSALYQPDTLAAYTVDGQRYLVSANEGDPREYGAFKDFTRVADLDCQLALRPTDMALIPDADGDGKVTERDVRHPEVLGRLKVANQAHVPPLQPCGELQTFGARSFSIWQADTGRLVYDSGNQFEVMTAQVHGASFNQGDKRSDDRGPEPEALALGRLAQHDYAFIGMERAAGIAVYDISEPERARFASYNTPVGMHVGLESMVFIPAQHNPVGRPLIAAAYEYSRSVVVYEVVRVQRDSEPVKLGQ